MDYIQQEKKRPYDIFICIYFSQNEICDIAVFMSMAKLASSFPSLVLFWAFWLLLLRAA